MLPLTPTLVCPSHNLLSVEPRAKHKHCAHEYLACGLCGPLAGNPCRAHQPTTVPSAAPTTCLAAARRSLLLPFRLEPPAAQPE